MKSFIENPYKLPDQNLRGVVILNTWVKIFLCSQYYAVFAQNVVLSCIIFFCAHFKML